MVANPMPDIKWTRRIFHDWSIEETGKNYIHKGFTMVINTGHVGIYNVTICNEMGCVDEHVPLKTEGTVFLRILQFSQLPNLHLYASLSCRCFVIHFRSYFT